MYIYERTDIRMFTAALFLIVKQTDRKLETTQMSINRRVDKQIMVYSYNGILFSNKKG